MSASGSPYWAAIALLLSQAAVAGTPSPDAEKTRIRTVALVGVAHGEGFTDAQADTLEELLLSALHRSGHFKVTSRSEVAAAVAFQAKRQMAGCQDDSCAVEVAKSMGVELVASGNVGRLGETTVLSLKLIDAHTAAAVARAQETLRGDDALPSAANSIARKLVLALWPDTAADASSGGPTITAGAEPTVGDDGTHVASRIASEHGILDPRVMWRYVGEASFRSEPMSRGDGADLYIATVPGRPVREALEYRIVVTDPVSSEQSAWPSMLSTARVASRAKTVEPATSGQAFALKLTVTARRPGEKTPAVLSGGEALYVGTQVAFSVNPNKPAYVYLAERHKSGAVEILFPNSGISTRNPIQPGQDIRIPARSWFVVDNEDLGRETVMLMASPTPLEDLEGTFGKASRGDIQTAQAGGALLATATGRPECRTRGLVLADSDECRPRTRGLILPTVDADVAGPGASVRISARAGDPVVFVPFEFEHVQQP